MTSPSERASIYYLTAEVVFRRHRRERKMVTWIVTCFTDPIDIMMYDRKTMRRLQRELYTPKAKNKPVTITRILTKKYLSKSHESLDDKKRPDSGRYEQGS